VSAQVIAPEGVLCGQSQGLCDRAQQLYGSRVSREYPYDARRKVDALIESMKSLIARDSEQEVRGIALAVVDAAINAVKTAKPDDPVVTTTSDLFSADQIATGEGVRAADLLVVAEQLAAALGPYPITIA